MATRKYSRQREAIKHFLDGRKDHPTADLIYTCLREEYPNLSLGTVYRNLALLTEMGEIARITTGSGAEHYDATVTPHQHFVCKECGSVFDVETDNLEPLLRAAVKACPGRIDSYTASFYGICDKCLHHSGSGGED